MSKQETKIIDGRALAIRIRNEAAEDIHKLDLYPGLGVILVGDDPASRLYVSLKEKACAEAGIRFEKFLFPDDTKEELVIRKIRELNERDDIDAILVQLPLPEYFDEDHVISAMNPAKDVDGFHPHAVLTPGLATGILLLTKEAGEPIEGKTLSVISNSSVFAKPVEKLFKKNSATLADSVKTADIIVIATGKPDSLTRDMIKPGAIVIDVGTTRVGNTIVGDADDLTGVASAITPVPGGVGPVTVAMLIRNTVALAKRRLGSG